MGFVTELAEVDRTQRAIVGGKGAHLGELRRIDGIRVPDGCCVTTAAFDAVVAASPDVRRLLSAAAPAAASLREVIEALPVPPALVDAIGAQLDRLGAGGAYAVRSSATAEDLPGASFAGQQDSYLDVVGLSAIVDHVRRCWASLFTDRAVAYRERNGIDHRTVRMAVVVQRMLAPDTSGVLFTADPVTSHRSVAAVEAVPGLGEALVSGMATPDSYTVRDGAVMTAAAEPLLGDAQVLRLVALGRRIEAHFGSPQDIEWCLVDGEFHVVQSRPITTLFPIPATADDGNHVYVSVGHQQMMTDPMTPLGLSVWQLTTPRPMAEAGGRLFVDVTAALAAPASRDSYLDALGKSDPRIRTALQTVIDRDGFLPPPPDHTPPPPGGTGASAIETDAAIVTDLIARNEQSVATLRRDIADVSGPAVFDFIADDLVELKSKLFDPRSTHVIMAGFAATEWLNENLFTWLGERNAADTLAQSVPNNITSEMGLALLDVADVIRPHPEVVAALEAGSLSLDDLPGGPACAAALTGFLDRFGMRCVGEIDITRPRWSEAPATLVPTILAHVRNFEPGEATRRFEQGRVEALDKERSVLAQLRALPEGEAVAEQTRLMIERLRTFVGYREYPKFGKICRYFEYKRALLREVQRLVAAGTLAAPDDAWFLRFEELRSAVSTGRVDHALIRRRRSDFESYRSLIPPRVMTSDGESIDGVAPRDDLPPDALVGLAVSAGTVEGRARVVTDLGSAELEPGDILVTAYTDPSWTPLFVTIAALVTEVGGMMTHGAVVAREYGLPAVVGVDLATRLIADGQQIRVHGADGYVELL